MDITSYILSKKYIEDTLAGAGAFAGKSAYEIACDNGFNGTVIEWLASLKGDTPQIGPNGTWVINGKDTGVIASPGLAGYATEEFVNQQIANIKFQEPDLSAYATREELNAAILGIIIPDVNEFATKEELSIAIESIQIPSLEGLATEEYVNNKIADIEDLIATETTTAMEFKGATASLPENPTKGDMWKVSATFKIGEESIKVGDAIVYNGEEWFIIPSGDDIEDTWRPVNGVNNDATLKFVAGDKLDVAVAADGTIIYSHEKIDAPELLAENEQTRTYITEVVTDEHGHVTGYKTATKNVEDTNTTYEFECAAEHSNVYFVVNEMNGEEKIASHTVCVNAYNKNEVDAKVKALNLEIYGNEAVQEISRIDIAVADAAEALRVASEASTAASDAKDGAVASAAAAEASAAEALTFQNAANASATAAAASEANAAASVTAATQKASAASQSADAAAQAKTDAEAAQVLAAGFAESANTAAFAIFGAKDAAIAAQEAAEGAKDEAVVKANAAVGSAEAALGFKNAAAESAATATSKANEAEVARVAAVSAKEAAELAEINAEAAEAAAEAAKVAAEVSNTSATAIANEAKAKAENAVVTANDAKEIAEAAIQDVANVANNGLILSKSADNKVSVDWDSNVVFVFNCGSAIELVD